MSDVTHQAAALLIHRLSEWSRKAALLLLSVRLCSFRDSRGKSRSRGPDSCQRTRRKKKKKKTITGIFCTVIHFAPVCAPENKVANLIYIANAFIYSTFTRSTLAVHVFCFVFYSFIYSDLLYLVLTGASRQQLVVGLAHSCVSAGQRSGEQRQWTHLQSRIFHPEQNKSSEWVRPKLFRYNPEWSKYNGLELFWHSLFVSRPSLLASEALTIGFQWPMWVK